MSEGQQFAVSVKTVNWLQGPGWGKGTWAWLSAKGPPASLAPGPAWSLKCGQKGNRFLPLGAERDVEPPSPPPPGLQWEGVGEGAWSL